MNAYEKLQELDLKTELDERAFFKIMREFKNEYLRVIGYQERVIHHRKPGELLEALLQQSYHDLRKIGERNEMQEIEIKDGSSSLRYVYTRVREIWKDKKINLYDAIKEYCRQTDKDFNTTVVHLAEYRALERVGIKIRSDQRRLNLRKKSDVSVKKEPTHISGLSGIRDYILGSMQSDAMMNLLAIRHIMPKPLRPFEFIENVFHAQNAFTNLGDIFKKLEPVRPKIIKGDSTFLTMFEIGIVSKINAEKYYSAFDYLAKTGTNLKEWRNYLTDNYSPLVEMEYEFLPEVQELEIPKLDTEQRIVLLNQGKRIRDIILDIYNNHAKLIQVAPRQFEELIAELLSSQGFKVELTKQTRDGGYDIIALYEMANQSPQKWLVECKKWNGKVGVEIIRSFKEVVQSQHANRGIIATTGYFTRDAIMKQQETPYLLDFKDKDGIMQWITTYANQVF